jgi:hypothetical protein
VVDRALARALSGLGMEQFFAELTLKTAESAKQWLLSELCERLADRSRLGVGSLVLNGGDLPTALGSGSLESFVHLEGFEPEGLFSNRLHSVMRSSNDPEVLADAVELAGLVQLAHPHGEFTAQIAHSALFAWDTEKTANAPYLWAVIRLIGALHETVSVGVVGTRSPWLVNWRYAGQ